MTRAFLDKGYMPVLLVNESGIHSIVQWKLPEYRSQADLGSNLSSVSY